jgi:hypothetical protein
METRKVHQSNDLMNVNIAQVLCVKDIKEEGDLIWMLIIRKLG